MIKDNLIDNNKDIVEDVGLLDKLLNIKKNNLTTDKSFTLIKVSSDLIIQDYCDKLVDTINRNFNFDSNNQCCKNLENLIFTSNNNIGFNRHILFCNNIVINMYDYNYLLSKKFKHLKSEPYLKSSCFILLINIHDSRGIQNIKLILEDIKIFCKYNSFKIHGLLITQENNFLLNLMKTNLIDNIKSQYNLNSYHEIDENDKNIINIINSLII